MAALLGGRLDIARAAFRAELSTGPRGQPDVTLEALIGLAALAALDGDDHRAATLDAAAHAVPAPHRPPAESERRVYDRIARQFLTPARERLGPEQWDAAGVAGRAMTADEAVAYALQTALLPD